MRIRGEVGKLYLVLINESFECLRIQFDFECTECTLSLSKTFAIPIVLDPLAGT